MDAIKWQKNQISTALHEALPGGGGEAHVAHLNFTTSCVGVYKCLSLIVGFAITVAIWPRDVVSCRNFILRAVATFWAMSLVGIYPGRASCTCTCKWIPCPTQVMGRQVPTSTNMSFVRELETKTSLEAISSPGQTNGTSCKHPKWSFIYQEINVQDFPKDFKSLSKIQGVLGGKSNLIC